MLDDVGRAFYQVDGTSSGIRWIHLPIFPPSFLSVRPLTQSSIRGEQVRVTHKFLSMNYAQRSHHSLSVDCTTIASMSSFCLLMSPGLEDFGSAVSASPTVRFFPHRDSNSDGDKTKERAESYEGPFHVAQSPASSSCSSERLKIV